MFLKLKKNRAIILYMPEKTPIGKITHYYNKIGVVVVELTEQLNIGDTIEIESGDSSFEQVVDSMQVEHEQVETAEAGSSVGMKVEHEVKPGAKVYKIEE